MSAVAAAGVAGIGVALLGSIVDRSVRSWFTVAIGCGAVLVAIAEARGHVGFLPHLSRETPPQWLDGSPLMWGLRNGASVGIAVTSRIKVGVWYVVPLSILALARPDEGLVIAGAYGGLRSSGALMLMPAYRSGGTRAVRVLQNRYKAIGRLASFWVLLLGGAVAFIVLLSSSRP
jgi:hypothetical protein